MNRNEIKSYFKEPTQVGFWDNDKEDYVGGIAFKRRIIRGDKPELVWIKEIIDSAPETVNEPVYEMDWLDISDNILNG